MYISDKGNTSNWMSEAKKAKSISQWGSNNPSKLIAKVN